MLPVFIIINKYSFKGIIFCINFHLLDTCDNPGTQIMCKTAWNMMQVSCTVSLDFIGSKNNTIHMYWQKSWVQKHVDKNLILESQIHSMMTFDVDTSQQKECVTTSDRKTELVAITLKRCEACHSVLTCWSVKYISIHKRAARAKRK